MFHVKFADIGEGIHEGVLLKLFFNEGDTVKEGDSLFTLETDKVNAEIPSPVDGVMKAIKYKVGSKVHVGDVIVVIDDGEPGIRSNMEGGEAITEESSGSGSTVEASNSAATPQLDQQAAPAVKHETVEEKGSTSVVGQIEISDEVIASSGEASAPVAAVSNKRVLATPVARKMAKDLGVDIQTVVGTGPQGRVMKDDIRKAAEAKGSVASKSSDAQTSSGSGMPSGGAASTASKEGRGGYPKYAVPQMDRVERVPMTMLRKTIADNMALAKFTIPHTAVMDEADVSELVAFRTEAKELASAEGVKLTYLAFFIKAVVAGLKKYKGLNASLDEVAEEIVYKQFYNIGIAVDTPDGLMVPVIKDADRLSVFEIAEKIEDLSARARTKSLKLDELGGGSFTITNYGAVGASFGVPVIRHPEAGILGVGAIVKKPVVKDDEIVIRSVLPLSLSFDHRILDGADAGRFVGLVKHLLENPKVLLMS